MMIRNNHSFIIGLMLTIYLFVMLVGTLQASINKSSGGNLHVDISDDSTIDMYLTPEGFGIGKEPANNLDVSGNGVISGNLFVGTSSGTETLEVSGAMGYSVESVSDNVTLSGNSQIVADTSVGNIYITLPEASDVMGRRYDITKSSSLNNIYVYGRYLDNNVTDFLLPSGEAASFLNLYSGGSTSWLITGMSGNGDLVSGDNLVGWWRFDESSGTAADSSDYSSTASLSNASYTTSGKLSGAVSFDGTNDRVTVSDPADGHLDFGTGDFTVSFWFYNASNGSSQFLISKKINGSTGWAILNNSGTFKLNFEAGGGGLSTDFTGASATLNAWQHVVVTLDRDGNATVFINGSSTATIDISGETATISTAEDVFMGEKNNPPTYGADMSGRLDDVRIYSRILSNSEISALGAL